MCHERVLPQGSFLQVSMPVSIISFEYRNSPSGAIAHVLQW
jgi:hypothetical protein